MHITRRHMMAIVNTKPRPLYTRLEYLISNDSFLNMMVTADNTTEVEYVGSYTRSIQDVFFGSDVWRLENDGWGDTFYYTVGKTSSTYTSSIPTGHHTLLFKADGLYVDGVLKLAGSGNIASNYYLFLFAANGKASRLTSVGEAQCKEVKVRKNGVLVRHLIPVLDRKNIVCFYDLVTGTFYYPLKATYSPCTFIAGPLYVEPDEPDIPVDPDVPVDPDPDVPEPDPDTPDEPDEPDVPVDPEIPDDVRVATYIISNGKQIIDTGINPDDTTEVEYYGTISNTAELAIMGTSANISPYTVNRFVFYSHTAGAGGNKYFYTGKTGWSYKSFSTETLAKYKMTKYGLYVDDTLRITPNTSQSIASDLNIWIFNSNYNGNPWTSTAGEFKCYGVRIWKQDKLVRDMIPILDGDNNYCLYDKISGNKYYDMNGGKFNGYIDDPDAPDVPVYINPKMDITFENNKFESIGTTTYSPLYSRNMTYVDGSLRIASNTYFQIPITGNFTTESTIQVLVNRTPTTENINNWFRFNCSPGYDMVFGYMTDEVLTAEKPFVVTFLLSNTLPRVVTYLNGNRIAESNPDRNPWIRLQVGPGDTSPKPVDLMIGRFRIFNERISEDDVLTYANELLGIKPEDDGDYDDIPEDSIPEI